MKYCRPICALLFLAIQLPTFASPSVGDDEKFNIILILADDLGYETIAANGGQSYRTPFLDRLAEQGARFEHCYAQPSCTPSRVQLMTGKYNFRNYEKFGVLPRAETTFAHFLKEAGYATCVAGKWQLGTDVDSPHHFGFDQALLWQHTRPRTREGSQHDTRYENPRFEFNGESIDYDGGEYGPDLLVDFICGFIEKNQDKPFFVYYPMLLTHCPFVPTPNSADWDPESQGSETYKGNAEYFGDMVSYVDKLVGRIAEEVARKGLAEKTVIIFTGDNGTDEPVVSILNGREVAGKKGKTTDAGTRVPLIVYGPGLVKPGVVNDLIDFSDFLPTLCDIAGIEVPAAIDGRSFLPQLRGETGNPREYIYAWYNPRSGNNKGAQVFARTHDYKLYRDGDFFNVLNDPRELHPLASEQLPESQAKVIVKLQTVLDKYESLRAN